MNEHVRWRLQVLAVALTAVLVAPAAAYELNGFVWPGSKPRIPFYISTSLMGNLPLADVAANNGHFDRRRL